MNDSYEILEFADPVKFREWLHAHHSSVDGIWLKIHKKNSGLVSVTYAEALDQALCYGWIDGMRKSYDESSFVQKFTPRRARSLWSKRNITYVERLTAAGLMHESGDTEVEKAKLDGRWQAAYDSPANMVLPDFFLDELSRHPKAKAVFELMSKSAKYAIGWQLQTAKREATKHARAQRIIAELESQ